MKRSFLSNATLISTEESTHWHQMLCGNQLPSVDEVKVFSNKSTFPDNGKAGNVIIRC
jgi:hypothetical protein